MTLRAEAARPPARTTPSLPPLPRSPPDSAPQIVRDVHTAYAAHGRAVKDRSDLPALAKLFAESLASLEPLQLVVLDLRLEHTLAAIAEELGVSRERIRQIETNARKNLLALAELHAGDMLEHWRKRLRATLVSERALFEGWEAAALDDRAEFRLARILLVAMRAVHPETYRGELKGWWTFDQTVLKRPLARISDALPLEDSDLDELAARVLPVPALSVRHLLSEPGSPAAFHQGVEAWVRRSAINRDAAYLVLLRAGEPMRSDSLANRVGTKPHAMREALRRDSRFVVLRPSRLWALCEWKEVEVSPYRNTLEAAVAVLSEHGPLSYREFERRVLERYPVSAWAVSHCLGTEEIGQFPDGRIGLTSAGAAVVEDDEPSCPPSVSQTDDCLAFELDVTRDVTRGSGLMIPLYVTWWLGLRIAPRKQEFEVTGAPAITIRRARTGPAISSLRRHALALGAIEGCRLRVTLNPSSGRADVTLGCACPSHQGFPGRTSFSLGERFR